MRHALILPMVAALLMAPLAAHAFEKVDDEGTFLKILQGKKLTNRLYGLTIDVSPSGGIVGDALGWEITGSWAWQDGYFCREMAWGGDPIPYNCQLVEVAGDEVRFTVDQGAGDSATFRLR